MKNLNLISEHEREVEIWRNSLKKAIVFLIPTFLLLLFSATFSLLTDSYDWFFRTSLGIFGGNILAIVAYSFAMRNANRKLKHLKSGGNLSDLLQ